MPLKTLILGASYGSLFGAKLAMAGHDATLVCREATAALINAEGVETRLRLKGETAHRAIRSTELPGRIDAAVPDQADPAAFDMVVLAMQEPQYADPSLRALLARIAAARRPCLSIMNMPPPPYLRRIPGLDAQALAGCFTDPEAWAGFDPALISLCSPDPQAFRPPDEKPNVLHVGLPTNFKAAEFADAAANAALRTLAADIDAARLDGREAPVKLRVHPSLFVPLAKWSMLLTGNYRCILSEGTRAIRDAVHDDVEASRAIYGFVDEIARRLGADPSDQVPFAKYAAAAETLLKPSSAARAVAAGATAIERVDRLVQAVGRQLDMRSPAIDDTVAAVDAALARNAQAAGAAAGVAAQ